MLYLDFPRELSCNTKKTRVLLSSPVFWGIKVYLYPILRDKRVYFPYFEGEKCIFTLFFGIKSMLYPDFPLELDCKHTKNKNSPIRPPIFRDKSLSFTLFLGILFDMEINPRESMERITLMIKIKSKENLFLNSWFESLHKRFDQYHLNDSTCKF